MTMQSDPLINRARGGARQLLRSLEAVPRAQRFAQLQSQLRSIAPVAPQMLQVEMERMLRDGYSSEFALHEALSRVLAELVLLQGRKAMGLGDGSLQSEPVAMQVYRGLLCAPGVAELATMALPSDQRQRAAQNWMLTASATGQCVGVTPPPPEQPPREEPQRDQAGEMIPLVASAGLLAVVLFVAWKLAD